MVEHGTCHLGLTDHLHDVSVGILGIIGRRTLGTLDKEVAHLDAMIEI